MPSSSGNVHFLFFISRKINNSSSKTINVQLQQLQLQCHIDLLFKKSATSAAGIIVQRDGRRRTFSTSLSITLTKVPARLDVIEFAFDFINGRLQTVPLYECQCDANLRRLQSVFVTSHVPSANVDERYLIRNRNMPVAADGNPVVSRFQHNGSFNRHVNLWNLFAEFYPLYGGEEGTLYYVCLVMNGDFVLVVDIDISR